MNIRAAQPGDLPQILRLNEESVRFLSPLNPARLALLLSQAAYSRVLEDSGQCVAFLLAFREGSTYDSPNYRWFASRYPQFLYIDRIVVGSSMQGRGVGRLFYQDLFTFARGCGLRFVTCEFDLEPPNPISRRFHERLGFQQVGTQTYGAANKLVSLQVLEFEGENMP